MSNHYHLVLSDPEGLLPVFVEELNKLIARSLNCHFGRWENFWSGGVQPSYVRLESEMNVLAKMVYTLANPTQAMLVARGQEWPGVRLFKHGRYKALKPAFFFRQCEKRGLPASIDLILSPAPVGCPKQAVDDVVTRAVRARERQLRERARRNGKRFAGAAAVRSRSIHQRPKRPAPRRGLNPRFACRDKWRRIEILSMDRAFVAAHAEARRAFIAGNSQVQFPPGTFQFVRSFGGRCDDA